MFLNTKSALKLTNLHKNFPPLAVGGGGGGLYPLDSLAFLFVVCYTTPPPHIEIPYPRHCVIIA